MNCTSVTSGTTLGATSSGVALGTCSGTADDDVWYKFVAIASSHTMQLKNIVSVGTASSTSLYAQVFSGDCGTLVSTRCISSNSTYTYLNNLTVGQTYYIRVYNYEANSGASIYSNSFELCVGTLPAAPSNDDCATAVNLTVNGTLTCGSTTTGTTLSATNSSIAVGTCTGTPDDDVWYQFTAVGSEHTVLLSNVVSVGSSSSTGLYTQIFSGACGSLTSIKCGTTNNTNVTGLTAGQIYYVRVYNNNANTATAIYANTFNICIGTPPPPPVNDNCSGAIALTVNPSYVMTSSVTSSTVSATATTGVTAPACSASGANDDVWYSFTATAARHLVNVLYSDNATTTQIYSGNCTGLTAMACFDGIWGNSNILLSALTVGQTYYVRVFSSTSTATTTSNFQIAITTPVVPANDTCATAVAIACGGTVQGDNSLATDDTLPTSTCGSTGSTASYKGVWYTVTATENGPITIDACGTQYDSYLRVYTGSCSGLTCFANTDGVGYADAGCTSNIYNAPKVTFTGVSGTTYYILLTGYAAARIGNYTISVTQGCGNLSTTESVTKKDGIRAYPNPFMDILNISDVKNVKSIMISDLSGKIVKTFAKPESTLRLGDLNAGMYLVILNMNDGSKQTFKAIKK
ncbi:T9SS type A sorting domain-containing protein [Chryseobacterium sp.]|uniref:T9SS type A sorting domain-containing protein n=1 Tax=Chryseobacterium sp. TaxID=1871047 RepID=UPI002896A0D3|nr:T9SS type A sorting domain-containing protein [Chryseobacterium sp.]